MEEEKSNGNNEIDGEEIKEQIMEKRLSNVSSKSLNLLISGKSSNIEI